MAAALALGGCAVLEKPEMDAVRRSGVEPYVVDKMRHADTLGPGEIIALSKARVGDDIIVRYISRTGVRFVLTKETAARMKRGGVSTRVLRAVAYESQVYVTDYQTSRAIIAADYLYPYGYGYGYPYGYPWYHGGGYYYGGGHYHGHGGDWHGHGHGDHGDHGHHGGHGHHH
jgi:hypothetical protein